MTIIRGGQGRSAEQVHDSAWGIVMVCFVCGALAPLLSMFCCGCCADLRDIGGSGAKGSPLNDADAKTAAHYQKASE